MKPKILWCVFKDDSPVIKSMDSDKYWCVYFFIQEFYRNIEPSIRANDAFVMQEWEKLMNDGYSCREVKVKVEVVG